MLTQNNSYRNPNDGYFDIVFQSDGVFLIVQPPTASGAKVSAADVLDKLNKKQVRNFDKRTVELVVAKASRIPEKIAEPQREEQIDAAVSISIAPDKMKAYAMIFPPEGGRMLTAEEFLDRMAESKVVFGAKEEIIQDICKNPVYNQQILIAEGALPVNGVNGKLEMKVDVHKNAKPTINEDGTVNFRELNLIENVTRGQVLVTSTPPTQGTPGKNVIGMPINALNGKPAVLPRGRNVEVSPDGTSLLASIDGLVNYLDGKVSVFSIYEVSADVDNSTGNINFVGNVLVHGNVLSGFTIEAGGNVEIFGVVEGATIKAGGNIILRRGMQGLGKGMLIADGDIVARYIEHSNIYARGDIKAEAIMHSNVRCGNKMELSGKKGLLVGGTAKVGREINAKVIGSPMATITEIEVGVDPGKRERYKTIKDEIVLAESDIMKSNQAIEILKKLEKVGKLPQEKLAILEKSIRTKDFYESRLVELREELERLDEELEQESNGRILVQSIAYPGTRVAIGTSLLNVRENLQYCSLYRDGADIRVGAYK
ncbi:MAG: DUF342 domain-containing protein [Deltaproteobacteria bacterium]